MKENFDKFQNEGKKIKESIQWQENEEEILFIDKYKNLESKEVLALFTGVDSLIEPWALIEILSLEESEREKLEKIYEDYKNNERVKKLIEYLSIYEEKIKKARIEDDQDAISYFIKEKEGLIKELTSIEKDFDKINILLKLPTKEKKLLSYLNKKDTFENYFSFVKKKEIEKRLAELIKNNWMEKRFYEIRPNFTIIEEIKYYSEPETVKYEELDNEGKEKEMLEKKRKGEVKECDLILKFDNVEINLKEVLNLKDWKFVHTDHFLCYYPKKEIYYCNPLNIFKLFALFHEIGHALDWEKNGKEYYNALKENTRKIFEIKTKAFNNEITKEEFEQLLAKLNEEGELLDAGAERRANKEVINIINTLVAKNSLPPDLFSESFVNKLIELQLYNKKSINLIKEKEYYSAYLKKKIKKVY